MMTNLQEQMSEVWDRIKKRWKLFLLAAELVVLLVAVVSYWQSASNLMQYEFTEEQIRQYTCDVYEACFGGEIDESYGQGLYDVIPENALFLRKGYYEYTVNYESTSGGSFCWPHTYVDYYNVIEQAVVYLEKGSCEGTRGFWLNADLNVALRFSYSGNGTARVTGFEIKETLAAANIRLFFTVLFLLVVNLVIGLSAYGRKHEITAQRKYVFAGLAAISLIASYPFFQAETHIGHDLFFHLTRIEGMKDGLLSGQFPVRINPAFYNGYGYANPVFYGELLLYIPALLRLLGFRLTVCYNIFGILVNLLTCFGSYYCFHKIFREPTAALASTFLYVLAPYRLVDIYLRSAVGEYTAFMFLPFVAYGLFRIFTEDVQQKQYKWCFWPLVLGLSGIIQSHVITGEMVGGLILAVCVMLLFLTLQKRRLWVLVKTVLLTLALNAWFLVPFVDFMFTENVNIANAAAPKMIQKTGLLIPQILGLFSDYSLIAGGASEGMAGTMPLYLGLALVLGMGLCATMLCIVKEEGDKRKKQAFLFLFFGILTTWMSTAYFPWDRICNMFSGIPQIASLVSNLQFVWRFLAPCSLLAAIATGFGLLFLHRKEGKLPFVATAMALCMMTGLSGMNLMHQCLFYGNSVVKSNMLGENTANHVTGAEYTLVGASYKAVTEIFEPRTYGEIQVSGYTKNGTSISLYVESGDAEGYVLLPLLAYKGYHAASEGGVITDRNLSKGEDMVVRVDIPANYSGQISVKYAGFWYWRAAEAVSWATMFYLGWTVLKNKKKKKGVLQHEPI